MESSAITCLQFDKWDTKPLHTVMVDRKSTQKVNVSLVQCHIRERTAPDSSSASI